MTFKNEYVPPHDKEGAIEFIRQSLAKARSDAEPRQFPHPLEHYSAHEHRLTEFVIDAREKLHRGYSVWDMWTIDHEREMVLVHKGSGREMEDSEQSFWSFMDRMGHYDFTTEELSRLALAPGGSARDTERTQQDFWEVVRRKRSDLNQVEVAITYKLLHFRGVSGRSAPDAESIMCIKEALREYGRRFILNLEAFEGCQVTLIDGSTGKRL